LIIPALNLGIVISLTAFRYSESGKYLLINIFTTLFYYSAIFISHLSLIIEAFSCWSIP